jgi:hypothetical protein
VGIECELHVVPPSVDLTVAPLPTATHSATLEQSTALSSGSFASIVPWVQLLPAFFEVDATPLRPPSPPTATQVVAEGHDTALKLPSPGAAPPDDGTTGARVSPCGTNHRVVDVGVGRGADGPVVVEDFPLWSTAATEIVAIEATRPTVATEAMSSRRARC